MGGRNGRITSILGLASLGYTVEMDCLKLGGKCLLALSVTSGCHVGSRTCRLTPECTCAYKRIMLAAFNGMGLREANCRTLWSIYLSLVWGTSIWSRDDVSAR